MKSEIQYLATRSTRQRLRLEDRFEFKTTAKGRRQKERQTQAYHYLRKTGALTHSFVTNETFTVIPIDGGTFIERLCRQRADLMQHWNLESTTLLIGAEDYMELMSGPEIRQLMTFRATVGFGRTIMGMEVRVIPWLKGMVIL